MDIIGYNIMFWSRIDGIALIWYT